MADPGASVAARRLLAFPPATPGSIPPSDRATPFRPVRRPSPGRQGARVIPQFSALGEALDQQRAELSETTTAADPELVAVFDLAGAVDTFMRAARLVEGLEFLTDLQEDRVDADDDFYYEDPTGVADDQVPQSLYMVMTNAQAVTELVRLFELWQEDPSVTFERGLNPLKQVFGLLRAIRRWGPEDRVRETGLLGQWREDVAVFGTQATSRVEIELWYRDDAGVRTASEARVRQVVESLGGTIVANSDLSIIAYHGVLADIPMAAVSRVLLEGPESIELLTTDSVMMVSPSVPMTFVAGEPASEPGVDFDTTPPSGLPSHRAARRRPPRQSRRPGGPPNRR